MTYIDEPMEVDVEPTVGRLNSALDRIRLDGHKDATAQTHILGKSLEKGRVKGVGGMKMHLLGKIKVIIEQGHWLCGDD